MARSSVRFQSAPRSPFSNSDLEDFSLNTPKEPHDSKPEPSKPRSSRLLYLSILIGCMSSLLLGYDIGVFSGAAIYIKERFQLSDVRVETLVGILNLIAGFGGFLIGHIADTKGRKVAMLISSVSFSIGALSMTLAYSYSSLMLGRIVTGVGIGGGLLIAPMYSAELAPKEIRGWLVSATEICINIGVFLGYLANAIFGSVDNVNLNWRLMLAMGLIPPVIIFASLFAIPESPRWLVKKARESEAGDVLKKIYPGDEDRANAELKEIIEIVEGESYGDEQSWRSILCLSRGSVLYHIMFVALGIQFFQQGTGEEAIVYYTPEILKEAGLPGTSSQLYFTVIMGFCRLIAVCVATYIIDRSGRRFLLVLSSCGISFSLIILSIASFSHAWKLSMIGICGYMAFFSVGFGPVTWVMCSEIFPSRIRGRALSVAIFLNRLISGICALSFLSMLKSLGGGAFLLFLVVSLSSILFVLKYVPETRNKSLEQIESEFHQAFKMRNMNNK